ncbi:MAG: A/G-specific adenine glycosylase [Verrucomicrobiota bacterium]
MPAKPDAIVNALTDWFARHARDLPWRRTLDPYAIWVSEIMLQQTQVKTVIPYWERWMRELPDAGALAKAPPERVLKLWEGLGYYTRARNLQKAAQAVVERHGGRFPDTFDEVLELPGIGRYTAGAICSIAFNQPTPILDGNVIRVLARLFAIEDNPRERAVNDRLWNLAEALVQTAQKTGWPETHACSVLNQALMELGALVCTPKNPACDACPVSRLCAARRRGIQESLPNLDQRAETTARHFATFLIQRDGRWLAQQRPAGVVNAHLWEFPNVESAHIPNDPCALAKAQWNITLAAADPMGTIKHSITRYRITQHVFRAQWPARSRLDPAGRWLTPGELDSLAFTSAHRKIARKFLR